MPNLSLLILALAAGLPLIAGEKTHGLTGRIFKGEYDANNEHTYHVAILRLNENDTTEHVCGGAIIDSRYVLTAAHCLYGLDKASLLIRSGWDMNPEKPQAERRVYHKVARVAYLKDYFHSECRSHEHDIAIVRVQRSFDLADDANFRKLGLPERDNDYEGYAAILTGYGVEKITIRVNRTDKSASKLLKYPEQLKYLDTEVIAVEECKRSAPVIVTNGNICTRQQNPNGFSCIGDSGGPLVHDGVVIGIKNTHNNQCVQNRPEMFTRVSVYLDFIEKVLNQEAAADVHYN